MRDWFAHDKILYSKLDQALQDFIKFNSVTLGYFGSSLATDDHPAPMRAHQVGLFAQTRHRTLVIIHSLLYTRTR